MSACAESSPRPGDKLRYSDYKLQLLMGGPQKNRFQVLLGPSGNDQVGSFAKDRGKGSLQTRKREPDFEGMQFEFSEADRKRSSLTTTSAAPKHITPEAPTGVPCGPWHGCAYVGQDQQLSSIRV